MPSCTDGGRPVLRRAHERSRTITIINLPDVRLYWAKRKGFLALSSKRPKMAYAMSAIGPKRKLLRRALYIKNI